jgi:hypothetical protein
MKPDSKKSSNICPFCGHKNPVGVLVCDSCGKVISGDTIGTTYRLDLPDNLREEQRTAVQQVNLNDRKLDFPPGGTFAIQIREVEAPLIFQPDSSNALLIGRRNNENTFKPEIDFYPFAGYLLGVSRKHALIYRQGTRLMLEDLGSSNGTFINGVRLKPNEPHPIFDGAEISIGNLHFTISF